MTTLHLIIPIFASLLVIMKFKKKKNFLKVRAKVRISRAQTHQEQKDGEPRPGLCQRHSERVGSLEPAAPGRRLPHGRAVPVALAGHGPAPAPHPHHGHPLRPAGAAARPPPPPAAGGRARRRPPHRPLQHQVLARRRGGDPAQADGRELPLRRPGAAHHEVFGRCGQGPYYYLY